MRVNPRWIATSSIMLIKNNLRIIVKKSAFGFDFWHNYCIKAIMQKMRYSVGLALSLLLAATAAKALNLGANITVSDNNNDGSSPATASHWYSGREDNETENNPNTITAQQWDLEGMYLLGGTTLSLVGGYDFKNGVTYSGHNYATGDIFIDTTGDANYGAGNSTQTSHAVTNLYGYEYAIRLTFGTTTTYSVYKLTQGTTTLQETTDVGSSSPWKFNNGVTAVDGYQNLAFSYGKLSGADVTAYGLLGGDSSHGNDNTHYYVMGFDLGFLPDGTYATIHYTAECGNDDLIGKARVPDTASTALLLSGALLAVAGLRRRLRA